MAEYKIGDIETLTGIKAHTIRIWEKRYGILVPERTGTHIRTYNDDELSYLLNITLLNKNGHKISKIAQLSDQEIKQLVWDIKANPVTEMSTEKLLLALIELDEWLFRETLTQLIDEHGFETTFVDHLIPFLDRIGVMWQVGSISPAQEHFMSNLIRQKIIAEIDKQPIPEKNTNAVMLFLPEHEWHEISLLFYHFLLRQKGVNTIYLGQSLPYDSLLDCIKRLQPSALLTSWLTAVDDDFTVNYFTQLSKDAGKIAIYAGGAQVNMKAHLICDYIKEVKKASDLNTLFD